MSSSWLRNHIRHHVVPGLKLLSGFHRQDVAAEGYYHKVLKMPAGVGKQPTSDDLLAYTTSADYKPLALRPSKKCSRPEAGLVYSAVSSFYPRHPKLREEALRILQRCDPETFMDEGRLMYSKTEGYKSSDVAHSIVKSSWRALKDIADGRTIILPGRDVWPWEILARREGYPTVYDPRISRMFCFGSSLGYGNVRTKLLQRVCLEEWGVKLDECLIFDTGFMGSIPAAIRKATGVDVPHLMLSSEQGSTHNAGMPWTQIFPHHKGARSKVLCIEYFPKYYKSGTVERTRPLNAFEAHDATGAEKPIQYLSDSLEFIKAAALTIWMWTHQSPRFIRQGKYQTTPADEPLVLTHEKIPY